MFCFRLFAMNANELRQYGKQMIDVVANYWDSLRKRPPLPDAKPGFMNKLVPSIHDKLIIIHTNLLLGTERMLQSFPLNILYSNFSEV